MPEPITLAVAAEETGKVAVKEAAETAIKEVSEAAIKDAAIKESLPTIENTSLEALKARNEALKTLNESLKNTEHPITGVPFKSRELVINGVEKEGVFPDFKEYRVFQARLPEKLLQANDYTQFKYCNEQLLGAYEKGTLNLKNFTENQIQQIKDGFKPNDYTWHHNEVKGRMELVKTNIHDATAHTGGKSIWGGGISNR